jgi:hypothetical protein
VVYRPGRTQHKEKGKIGSYNAVQVLEFCDEWIGSLLHYDKSQALSMTLCMIFYGTWTRFSDFNRVINSTENDDISVFGPHSDSD